MFSFKKDYAGPSRLMYYSPWYSKDTILRDKRKVPKSISLNGIELKKPFELSQSFHDMNSLEKFWENYYESSEFKIQYSTFQIQKMFKNNGRCLVLKDDDKNIYATLFSYEPFGNTHINGKIQKIRFIEGVVVNHKMKEYISKWLFSWMEYLVPSIYVYTSDALSNSICSSYSSYSYYAISKNYIQNDDVGVVERVSKNEFFLIQDKYISQYKNSLNFIYSLNDDTAELEVYKVPIQFYNNSYYIIGVTNTRKLLKKFNLPTYEVVFCVIVSNDTIISPTDEEKYLTRYAIESVCKFGNYPLLLISSKEVSGDIYKYDTTWKMIKINKKNLYIYNYLANGYNSPSIYFPK